MFNLNNRKRVARIDTIAALYQPVSGTDWLDFATDLIADLAHWCIVHELDLDHAITALAV